VLSPLRDEGVLILGSGFLTHNMSYAFRKGIPSWAKEFDDWVAAVTARLDLDALVDFQVKAPGADLALPSWEHYAPLLVTAGAAVGGTSAPSVGFPITGWWMDMPFTKRSVQFG
jgi:4,5-DOPA dioxygenase extradiol